MSCYFFVYFCVVFNQNQSVTNCGASSYYSCKPTVIHNNNDDNVPLYENGENFLEHFATFRRPNLPRPKIKPVPPPRQIFCCRFLLFLFFYFNFKIFLNFLFLNFA